jgi:hypothetical protein
MSRAIDTLRGRPDLVVLASSSPKRGRWIDTVVGVPQARVSGGDEEDTPDVHRITRDKIRYARGQLTHSIKLPPHRNLIIVAADVRNRVLVPGETPDAPTLLISKRKPVNYDEPRETFRRMGNAAEQSGVRPMFMIDAAGAVDLYNGAKPKLALATSTVELDPEATKRLATQRGYDQYAKEVEQFYANPGYQREVGQRDPVLVTDICSGLSLTVLAKMGAVAAVDNVEYDDPEFRNRLRGGVHAAYVGLRPSLFKGIVPDEKAFRARHAGFTLVNNSVDRALARS